MASQTLQGNSWSIKKIQYSIINSYKNWQTIINNINNKLIAKLPITSRHPTQQISKTKQQMTQPQKTTKTRKIITATRLLLQLRMKRHNPWAVWWRSIKRKGRLCFARCSRGKSANARKNCPNWVCRRCRRSPSSSSKRCRVGRRARCEGP